MAIDDTSPLHASTDGLLKGPNGFKGQQWATQDEVYPFWDPKQEQLYVELDPQLAASVSRVRLEVNGFLLPASRTRQQLSLRPVPGAEDQYTEVAGLYTLRQLIHGAQLLPCKALSLDPQQEAHGDGKGGGGKQQRLELMLCVHWPLAPVGQQGGIDEALYGQRMAATGTLTATPDAPCGSLLRGSVDVLRSLMILPPAELLLRPLHCMMAFQLDGALIPVQEPVQLRPQPGSGARWFEVFGVKGFAHLIIENTVTGCSRWWPKTDAQQAGGDACFAPGLLVVSLSTPPQQPQTDPPSARLPASTTTATCTPHATHHNKQGQPGGPGPAPSIKASSKDQSAPVTASSSHVQQVTPATHLAPAVTAPQDPGGLPSSLRPPSSANACRPPSQAGCVVAGRLAPSAPPPTTPGCPASAGKQQPEAVTDGLTAAVNGVVPAWGPAGASLQLVLPAPLADTCAGVRLEVGGVLLPAGCTQQMKLVHAAGTQDVWEVALPQNLRPFVVVATLLPCKALPAIGSAQVEKGSKRWELVIRVRWPTAQLGQKGGVDTTAYSACLDGQGSVVHYPCSRQLHLSKNTLASLQLPLPLDGTLPPIIHCMAAVQLDNHLIPLQQPVCLRQAGFDGYRVSDHCLRALLDCAQVTGFCRWLPQGPVEDVCGADTMPGLLVFQLTSKTTPQQGQVRDHSTRSSTGQPHKQGAGKSYHTSAPGARRDAAPPQFHQKGKRKRNCSELRRLELDTGKGRRMPPVSARRKRSQPPVNYTWPAAKRVRTDAGPKPAATKAPPSKAHAAPKAAAPASPPAKRTHQLAAALVKGSIKAKANGKKACSPYIVRARLRANKVSISCNQYLDGMKISSDIVPQFSTTVLASKGLLDALQLEQWASPAISHKQATKGQGKDQSTTANGTGQGQGASKQGSNAAGAPYTTWAALEVDGSLDPIAYQIRFTPTTSPGNHYYLVGFPGIFHRLRGVLQGLRLERWLPPSSAPAPAKHLPPPPPLLVIKATTTSHQRHKQQCTTAKPSAARQSAGTGSKAPASIGKGKAGAPAAAAAAATAASAKGASGSQPSTKRASSQDGHTVRATSSKGAGIAKLGVVHKGVSSTGKSAQQNKQQSPAGAGATAAGMSPHPTISRIGAHQHPQQQGKVSKVTSKVKAMPLELPHPVLKTRSGTPIAAHGANSRKGTKPQASQRPAAVPDEVADGGGSNKDGGTSHTTTDAERQRPGKRARVQGGGKAQEDGIHREPPGGRPGDVHQVDGTGAPKQLQNKAPATPRCQPKPMAKQLQQPLQRSQPDKPPVGKQLPASVRPEAPAVIVSDRNPGGGSRGDEGTRDLPSKHPRTEVTAYVQANRGSNSGSAGLEAEPRAAKPATDEDRGRTQLFTTAPDVAVGQQQHHQAPASMHPVQSPHTPPATAPKQPTSSPPSSELPASAVPAFCSSHLQQQQQQRQGAGPAVPAERPDVQLPLPKRVSRLMSRLLDPSIGPISAGEMASVLGCLHSNGSPAALCLATALSSIPVGRGASGEARSALNKAVFNWQVSCL